eukprot:6466573-Pyramimonas_sp.AAC.1
MSHAAPEYAVKQEQEPSYVQCPWPLHSPFAGHVAARSAYAHEECWSMKSKRPSCFTAVAGS